MPAFRVWYHKVPEGVDLEPMDRILGRDDSVLQAGDVDELEIRIYDVHTRTLVYSLLAIAPGNGVAGPVFSTLQLDSRWKPGPPGYNMRHLITQAELAAYSPPCVLQPGHHYRVEIRLETDAWGPITTVHDYEVESVYSAP